MTYEQELRDFRGSLRSKAQATPVAGRCGSSPESRVVGASNAVIDFGVLNAALAAFPTKVTVPLLVYNTAAVVLAATNSFVWNRRFTFRVRGPLLAGEVARFAVVAAGTAGLNDLVLLVLSVVFKEDRAF